MLGPIEARHDGAAVKVGGGRQLALLALLLTHAGEVVSRDRLLEELWRGAPPAGAGRSLDAYVSRLRRALREAGVRDLLETHAPGYLLRSEPAAARRFLALAAEGHAALATGDAANAAERLRAALALWRGRAYLEVADEPWVRAEVERLEAWRLSALEDRIDADLALGQHAAVVPELEGLAAAHPGRERFVGQLMLALYRSGRQTEALETFRRARAALVEDLGLEPGPALRRLEAAVLRHDRALDVSIAPPPAPSPAAAASRPRRRGRRAGAAALAAIVAVAAVAAVVLSTRPGGRAPVLSAESVGALEPGSGRVAASVAVGAEPAAVAAAAGRIWIADDVRDTVSRIDPRGPHVEQTLPVGSAPTALVAGAGALWVADARGGSLSRVDPRAGVLVQTIPAGTHPVAVAFGAGAVWVADAGGSAVVAVDARTGAVRRRIGLSAQPAGIAVGFGSVWVTEPIRRRLVRLDPRSGAIADEIDVGGGAAAIAVGGGAVWVVNRLDGTVSRIDPTTDAVSATTPVGAAPVGVVAGPSSVWVADAAGLVAVDPRTAALRRRYAVGAAPTAVTLLDGRPWLATSGPTGRGHRGGTLRVVTADDLSLVDPARFEGIAPGIWRATGDGLVAQTGDAGAAELVPDLAVALPRPTAHGRAYAFRLRAGPRYGTGAPVRASDFRRAFERLFASRAPAAVLYEALVGAAACERRPDRCDLRRGVVADDRAGTVVLRLTRPEPLLPFRLSLPAARPVPPGTPAPRPAAAPVPSTGPYRVARLLPGRELDLERNPHTSSPGRSPRSPTATPTASKSATSPTPTHAPEASAPVAPTSRST